MIKCDKVIIFALLLQNMMMKMTFYSRFIYTLLVSFMCGVPYIKAINTSFVNFDKITALQILSVDSPIQNC